MTVPAQRERLRAQAASVGARAKDARDKHISVAVPRSGQEQARRSERARGRDRLPAFLLADPVRPRHRRRAGFADAETPRRR